VKEIDSIQSLLKNCPVSDTELISMKEIDSIQSLLKNYPMADNGIDFHERVSKNYHRRVDIRN